MDCTREMDNRRDPLHPLDCSVGKKKKTSSLVISSVIVMHFFL